MICSAVSFTGGTELVVCVVEGFTDMGNAGAFVVVLTVVGVSVMVVVGPSVVVLAVVGGSVIFVSGSANCWYLGSCIFRRWWICSSR